MAQHVFTSNMLHCSTAKKYSPRITPEAWQEHREVIIARYKNSTLQATLEWMRSELNFVVSSVFAGTLGFKLVKLTRGRLSQLRKQLYIRWNVPKYGDRFDTTVETNTEST